MKKFLSIILGLTLFSLVGCSSDEPSLMEEEATTEVVTTTMTETTSLILPDNVELTVGSSFLLTLDAEDVTWFTSDSNVATVTQDGTVTIVGVGTVTIMATDENGNTYVLTFDSFEGVTTVTEEVTTEEIIDESETKKVNLDIAESTEQDNFSFSDIANREFCWSIGAGAWESILTISADGTFEGYYNDWDGGGVDLEGNDRTNVNYHSDFSGRFAEPVQVDDYIYSSKIKYFNYDSEVNTEEEIGDALYVYIDPTGIGEDYDVLIYTPGMLIADLPEEVLSWMYYRPDGQLNGYILYVYGPELNYNSAYLSYNT